MSSEPQNHFYHDDKSPSVRWWKRAIRIAIALLIVAGGGGGALWFIKTAPKPQKRSPVKWVPLVQVAAFAPGRHQVMVKAMGTVMPARTVSLEARVAGPVVALHPEFVEGGFVGRAEVLVQLEDDDYRLALAQRRSDLVNAQYALSLEQGHQEVARREWQLLQGGARENGASDLALRKPHLEKAQADVASARAALDKAALDLERTRIRAPFNAIVRNRTVEVGSQVAAQEPLADLVGTDVYWIQATLPVDRLDWIDVPQRAGDPGAAVRVLYNGDHVVRAEVVRLLADLTDQGRMARLLIAVNDPLGRAPEAAPRPPLLIGQYVRVEIEGRHLDNVFAVPRTVLRDDDTVWLLDPDQRLEIRKVKPVWRDQEVVLLQDHLKPGDRLIVSDLSAPVAGMQLRIDPPKPAAGGKEGRIADADRPVADQSR